MSVGEQVFHQGTVVRVHTGMVYAKSIGQNFLEIRVLDCDDLLSEYFLRHAAVATESGGLVVGHGHIPQGLGGLSGFGSAMYEDEQLMVVSALRERTIVTYFVLELEPLERIPLRDTNVLHLKRHGSVRMIEEEETLGGVDS
mmetsp:Transcript_41497/g.47163  ORF Transcript_41497/g.47163 Transcript_41497/m.47163 type:complete len:142 (+) Transcript_41497:64-489(+)